MKLHHAKQEGLRKEACSGTTRASVLMKVLYGARIARFDLLRQVNRLATNITRWTTGNDKKLHHLMCYIHHTKHWRMIGWVGDSVEDMYLAVYADADFSGRADSLRRHLAVT